MQRKVRIHISGRVQGVGFRPTVWRQAVALGLTGFVRNVPAGVVLEASGAAAAVERLIAALRLRPPRQARIAALRVEEMAAAGRVASSFEIEHSAHSGDLQVGLPPDLAICAECRDELFDKANRRYRHPFINCTNCGPRFTIVARLPYDRESTSMAAFELCPACRAEYANPADRRFDAQPNACLECGPRLRLLDASGASRPGDPLDEALKLLRSGQILAIKSLGGYHLSCAAADAAALERLRARKHRPAKSLAVMFASLEELKRHCAVSLAEQAALLSEVAPIVILKRLATSTLPRLISPDTNDIGAFLPYTPLHHLLLAGLSPLVMTSANRAAEPIAITEQQLQPLLGTVADGALVHDRAILRRCDDSVLKLAAGQPLLLRRSRGLVPDPIGLPWSAPAILACGADLKSSIALTRADQVFLSQHIGDLEDYAAARFFRETIADFSALLGVRPSIVAHDLHPDYHSTRYALSAEAPPGQRLAVQHHHAHIAAGMLEHRLLAPLIGVALDGTGYGPDGSIWGGEFMVADLRSYRRLAHFKNYRLPGGAAAIQHPQRMAFSILLSEGLEAPPALLPELDTVQRAQLRALLLQGQHAPLSSSAGRLFDAVAALLGLGAEVSYEARAAIRLQSLADPRVVASYPFALLDEPPDGWVLSFGASLRALLADRLAGQRPAVIAAKFHNSVAAGVLAVCQRIRAVEGLQQVLLTGGVFQNDLLLELVRRSLRAAGFQVYSHSRVPPNDGGIALGQAAVALASVAQPAGPRP